MKETLIIAGLLMSTSAYALTTIDNSPRTPDSVTPGGGIAAVGELAPFEDGLPAFFGESFIAPTVDTFAESLTFFAETFLRDILRQQGPTKFRVLLNECPQDADQGCKLDKTLFASPEIDLPQNSKWTDFNVNLGHTELVAGQKYLWAIDGYTFRNGLTGEATIGTKNNWPGGDMYFGGYLASSGVDLSTVSLETFPGVDLAFKMAFDVPAAPETSTWVMMLAGWVLLWFAANWRRPRLPRFFI